MTVPLQPAPLLGQIAAVTGRKAPPEPVAERVVDGLPGAEPLLAGEWFG
ncbi:hypothetical protein [Actinoplanes sp. N902-109]|nr:hypothetical protein [Actinoplanes sp. N902-109]AGL17587.1 hypothetical protein L083_4077 [Actinoplanes sp. N902-109]